MASNFIFPADEVELCEAIMSAATKRERLAIHGGSSKRDVGRLVDATRLDMSTFTGIVDYDPHELVLTARAGTPLADIQKLVAEQGQMLAFDPFDHGPLFGRPAGQSTIGGVVAAGAAGSQRLAFGGVRDHLLGCRAVSGRGELFVSGAKVVKNVTGFDIPKLLAGSWGRLAAITELTLKVLPAPRLTVTLVLTGLDPVRAVAAMTAAMASQAEVAAAAHLPGTVAVTALRVQGFQASVTARCALLTQCLTVFGQLELVAAKEGEAIWGALRTLAPLPSDRPLWKISIPPAAGGALVQQIEKTGAQWLLDWAGGLVWVASDEPALVRSAAAEAGGHAMLVRAPPAMRDVVPAFHPQAMGVAAIEQRVRRNFDPHGVFETGRF